MLLVRRNDLRKDDITMSYLRTKVVEQAKAWLGYNEADGSHKKIIDIYNSHKPLARGYKVTYTDPWCATFVSAVAIHLGYTAIIPTECSCNKMIELLKKLGAWEESDSRKPNPGDILFYDWDDNGVGENKSGVEHVGIVEKVSGNTITVIEGNYKNAVTRRTIEVNGKYIRGYGVPKYDKEVNQKKIKVDGIWGVETTTRAQEVFGTTVDGKVSNQYFKYAKNNPGLSPATFEWEQNPKGSSKLIKAIQKKIGAEPDGHIGPSTILHMQKWLGTKTDGYVSRPSQMVKAFQTWLNEQ
jgi:hypothetical protein